MSHWGYTKEDGPTYWLTIAPDGKGKRQSPIDIQPDKCTYDPELAKPALQWTYDPTKALNVENNGHSVQVNYDSAGSSLKGGPLKHKYQLLQFHLHWGKAKDSGSEHTVDGKMSDAELHLVHWNTEQFASFSEAAKADNGLCVLGIFLQEKEGAADHEGFKQMSDLLDLVGYHGDKEVLKSGLDPTKLLPGNTTDYWTYPGSLTTPPLYESVTWVVFKESIQVSEKQMTKLRGLYQNKKGQSVIKDEFQGRIIENYRPPQALNSRKVRASFK